MAEVIVHPDIEDVLVTYLTAQLTARGDTATVHAEMPPVRPARCVLVPRVGGTIRNLVVDEALIGIECWANTSASAAQLCYLVRGLVRAARGTTISGVTVYDIQEATGPAKLPDPESAQARYIYTPLVQYRGTTI